MSPIANQFFISQDYAEAIAKRLPMEYITDTTDLYYESDTRQILDAYPIQLDETEPPAAYVINYSNDEGYVIISADARYQPILSFSKNGQLSKNDTLPSMFAEWLGYNMENVALIKSGNYHDMTSVAGFNSKWQALHLDLI